MINKDGKLFGKINLLDILIVVAIIAVAIFAFMRFSRGGGSGIIGGGGETAVHTIKFISPLTFADTVEGIHVGGAVSQHGSELSFGTITNVEVSPAIEFRPNSDGILVGSEWGDRRNVEITAEIELPVGAHNHGLNIQGNRFAIGQSVTIRAADSVLFLRVSDFFEGRENE